MNINKIIAAWNANYINSWAHLGEDKKLEWAMKQEREACAKVCVDLPAPDIYSNTEKSMWDVTCIDCAEAIMERGQA